MSDTNPARADQNRTPLPEGTVPVGIGLLISGVAIYAFFKVGQQALGKESFKPVMALWFVAFTLVPGFFIPVEQELGRALAHRRALGDGGRPVVSRMITLAVGISVLITVAILAVSPWLTTHLFEGHAVVTASLVLSIFTYAFVHIARGISSGSGRFIAYSTVLSADSGIRILAAIVLWLAGVDSIAAFAFVIALSPLAAVLIVWRRGDLRTEDGPPIALAAITPNLGWLLLGNIMGAALVNAGPLGVDVLATSSEAAKVTAFGNGVLLSRIPLFLFQAIQASLLPRLAKLAAQGNLRDFRAGFNRLMIVVAAIAVLGVIGSFVAGPAVLDVMYGGGLTRTTLAFLALASGFLMLAMAVAQAVIALQGHRWVAVSWFAGAATFVITVATVSDDLYRRVEIGLILSCAVSFVVLLAAMRSRIAAGAIPDAESLVDGIFDSTFEG